MEQPLRKSQCGQTSGGWEQCLKDAHVCTLENR